MRPDATPGAPAEATVPPGDDPAADGAAAPAFPRAGLTGPVRLDSTLDLDAAIASLARFGSQETIAFDSDAAGFAPGSVDWAGLLAELPARASIVAAGGAPRPSSAGRAGGPPPGAVSTDNFETSDIILVSPTPSAERPSGVDLPDFVLRECVGAGGMGEVWRAWQTSLAREVAVKTLRSGDLREFLQEAYTSAELDHPNIVPVHELGRSADGASPLLVMKLVRGETWSGLLERERAMRGRQPERFLVRHLRILTDVCNAVAYAHSKGIIHRDLKPHQVMVGRFGEVFLMDWGLAISTQDRAPIIRHRGIPKYHTLRTASNRCGSPAYMAPEQTDATTERLGTATDVYLLGAILYEIVAGCAPHAADTARAAYFMAVTNDIHPLPAEAPAELRELIGRCLATRPVDRPSGPEELRDALEDFLSGAGRRRESTEIADEVEAQLEANSPDLHDYHQLLHLEQRIARSLQLWPENERARGLQVAVVTRHAGLALLGRDLRLAETLAATLPAGSEDRERLLSGVAEAHAQQRRAAYQRRLAFLVSGGLLIALVAGGIRFYVEQAATSRVIAGQAASAEEVMNFMLISLRRELEKVGRLDLMEDVARRAVDYYDHLPERGMGADSRRHRSTALWNLGSVLNQRGELARAEALYAEAAGLLDELLAAEPDDVTYLGDRATVDSLRGDLAARRGDLAAAERFFRRARDTRERLVALRPESHVTLFNMAVAESRFAVVARERGDLEEAMARALAAMARRERLAAADPSTPEWRRHLSRGHQDLGDIHHERGDLATARAEFEETVATLRALVDLNPDHAGWRFDLARALDRLGIVLVKQGHEREALALYDEALALRAQLLARDPANATYLASTAYGHYNVATTHQRGRRFAEALGHFEQSLALRRRSASLDGADVRAREELCASLRAVGVVLGDLGRAEEGRAHLEEAVEIARRLVGSGADRYAARDELASSLGELGLLEHGAGRGEDALRLLAEGVALREEMVRHDPTNGQWSYELARAEQWLATAECAGGDAAARAAGLARFGRSLERLAALVAERPSHTAWRVQEAASHRRFAELLAEAGETERAAHHRREAERLQAGLSASPATETARD